MNGVAEIPGLDILPADLGGSRLVADLLASQPEAVRLFAGAPGDLDAYTRKARQVAQRMPASVRALVADAIHAPSDNARAKLDRILAGEGVLVTTGQQAGLFGGPLLTVYKALTAVRLARELESSLAMPVAAAFWVAADDHDWAEVNHVDIVDVSNTLQRFEIDEDGPPHPMSARRLATNVEGTIDAFMAALPDTDFSAAVGAWLRASYRPGATMSAAFAALLARLFEPFDLLIVDPAHPSIKAGSRPVIDRELRAAAEHAAMLEARAKSLEASGYDVQVTVASDASNVFYHGQDGRDRIAFDADGWYLRRTKERISDSELRARLESSPERFSPNVLLRPVVEATVLPTICYVAGPSEISYFAQIGPLFEAHEVAPMMVHPRAGFTLIEARVRKVLDKFGLEADDFSVPLHELKARVARDEMPDSVAATLETIRAGIRQHWAQLADGAETVDPTLRGWIETQRNQALSQTDNIEKKIASHVRRGAEVAMRQLEKAAVHLYPNGTPQQRFLNVFQYIARYGPDLLDVLSQHITPALASSETADASAP